MHIAYGTDSEPDVWQDFVATSAAPRLFGVLAFWACPGWYFPSRIGSGVNCFGQWIVCGSYTGPFQLEA